MKLDMDWVKKIGYLPRYLEAIRDGLTLMIDKMDVIQKHIAKNAVILLNCTKSNR